MSDAHEELTIIVGYDGSEAAQRALGRVRRLGEPVSKILLVAVVPDIRSAGFGTEFSQEAADPQPLLQVARARLGAPAGTTIDTRSVIGDPAAVLVDVAREVRADLLVVGRRGGDFVARTLLGSVAQRVVQQAPCDVLVVA